ncbi:MAG: hypothetical protein FD153_108 [Rhodospirillaceae bacterium]|nr:MAG: hypothetical protein FD153_108 [Rhodospirillaceae bacterium]
MMPYQQERREQQKEQERQEARQKRMTEAWRKTLNDPDERMVLAQLLDYCGLFRSSLVAGMDKVLVLEGQRQVALLIQGVCLMADPAAYKQLLSESTGNNHDGNNGTNWNCGD